MAGDAAERLPRRHHVHDGRGPRSPEPAPDGITSTWPTMIRSTSATPLASARARTLVWLRAAIDPSVSPGLTVWRSPSSAAAPVPTAISATAAAAATAAR